ncbi:pyridoxamine 5'-phosphate oxidase-related FMN-binding protein (macronuclear) [Tetrahymena thermophila SB210]|uniref:Pyridoxamine 5'-phosphate oxidase-related FMN-binding protein n=1 Tax=Tetrahymena thermophila (strain SB210) TaxID=312017 RepID=I7M1Q9_TETTS|nr:pyridoxamine 5'-phosphate oxidase-related FMN-binding protein [Tetrahymena thermophila SB210]EAR97373.3 pyridoxamine 5'-phosphate oxidase-related FMN-binding protein [Tetrahymena thermophila SB210]|eukprot:XP_001017618.3 pyridoxamine 5'-phosphate oxidase-related FMN-binding protein [Tetrahymena thermophila SB210]
MQEAQQDLPQWLKALKRSIINNRQLQFSNMSQIAYVFNGEAGIDNITFDSYEKVISDNPLQEYSLIYTIDSRKNTFNEMKNNKVVELCWYFPLTKEQYKIKCHFSFIALQQTQINDIQITEEILIEQLPQNQRELLENAWNKVDKEAKKLYQSPHPDTCKPNQEPLDDLERFNTPEKNKISNNFALLVLTPFRMEHTSFAMPQVVADGRKEFESIFKPYKKHSKYLYVIENNQWKVHTLNP